MDINYYKWVEIKVTHSYFEKAVCPVIGLQAFQESIKSMKHYELLVHRKNNLFTFYVGISGPKILDIAKIWPAVKEVLADLDYLFFKLDFEDHLFMNYTNIPAPDSGQSFYLTNSTGSSTLQQSNIVDDKDLVNTKPRSFVVKIPSSTSTIEIKSAGKEIATWKMGSPITATTTAEEKAQIMREKVVVFTMNDSTSNEVQVFLNQQKTGLYEIWIDNKISETFFYTREEVSPMLPGIIQLNIQELLGENSGAVELSLDFEAPSVNWRYKIINPDSEKVGIKQVGIIVQEVYQPEEKDPTNPSILLKPKVPYNKSQKNEKITSGQMAQVYTSPSPMPLQEKLMHNPKLKITYPINGSTTRQEVEIDLPNPSPEHLENFINEQREESICATTIVYI